MIDRPQPMLGYVGINPGHSGGPVVDAQKQVVGVASAKVNAGGIGLAIPISIACYSFSGI